MHKLKLAILSSMLCVNAFATPVYQPPGQNLTYGSSSNNQSIMSSIANPAAAAAQLGKEDSQYRFGLINIGGGYEFGKIDDLYNLIDNSKNTITDPITQPEMEGLYATHCGTTTTCNNATAFANGIASTINNSTAIATLNTVLSQLQQDGNASVFFGGHIPLTPFVISRKGWGGGFVLDANASVIANMSFLADPLFISDATATSIATAYTDAASAQNTTTPVYTLPTIPNDSTLLVKGAAVGEIGLGYSRSVLRREAPELKEGEPTPGKLSASQLKAGELTAGVRVKYYQVKLARAAQRLTQTTDGAESTFDSDLIYTTSSGFGLDVGTLWTSKHYRAGAWVNNLNSPSFKYPTIDTAAYDTSRGVKTQLDAGATYEMKPQLQLEGAVYSESQNWVVNAGLDANAVPDPVGREFQWLTLSGAYATDSWWIPGARIGYRTNLAGSKLGYVTGGLTLFKALSLDVAYGLDSVTDDKGNKIPRSAMINLGVQMTF